MDFHDHVVDSLMSGQEQSICVIVLSHVIMIQVFHQHSRDIDAGAIVTK